MKKNIIKQCLGLENLDGTPVVPATEETVAVVTMTEGEITEVLLEVEENTEAAEEIVEAVEEIKGTQEGLIEVQAALGTISQENFSDDVATFARLAIKANLARINVPAARFVPSLESASGNYLATTQSEIANLIASLENGIETGTAQMGEAVTEAALSLFKGYEANGVLAEQLAEKVKDLVGEPTAATFSFADAVVLADNGVVSAEGILTKLDRLDSVLGDLYGAYATSLTTFLKDANDKYVALTTAEGADPVQAQADFVTWMKEAVAKVATVETEATVLDIVAVEGQGTDIGAFSLDDIKKIAAATGKISKTVAAGREKYDALWAEAKKAVDTCYTGEAAALSDWSLIKPVYDVSSDAFKVAHAAVDAASIAGGLFMTKEQKEAADAAVTAAAEAAAAGGGSAADIAAAVVEAVVEVVPDAQAAEVVAAVADVAPAAATDTGATA